MNKDNITAEWFTCEGILLDRNEWRKLIHVPDLA